MGTIEYIVGGVIAAGAIVIGIVGTKRGYIYKDEVVRIVKKLRDITSKESDGGRNITISEAEELVSEVVHDYTNSNKE